MAESPPSWLSSRTDAATPPEADSITTAYWVSSVSAGLERGSMRTPWIGTKSANIWALTRTPSAKRYHFTVKNGAPADSTTNGDVHPAAPHSVRVMIGRK